MSPILTVFPIFIVRKKSQDVRLLQNKKRVTLLYRVSKCPSFGHKPSGTCYNQGGLPLKADVQSKAPQSQSGFIKSQERKTVHSFLLVPILKSYYKCWKNSVSHAVYYLHPQSHMKLRLEKQGGLIWSLDIAMPSKKVVGSVLSQPLYQISRKVRKITTLFYVGSLVRLCFRPTSLMCTSQQRGKGTLLQETGGQPPPSEIPAGVTVSLADTVQKGELIPLLPAKAAAIGGGQTSPFPADEEGDTSAVDFFRSPTLSYKRTKHLALLPPWTGHRSLSLSERCLAGRLF